MKLMFLENSSKNGTMSGGGLLNKLLHLNEPEKNFQNFVKEIKGIGGKMIDNQNKKFEYVPASKSRSLIQKIKK